MKVGIVSILFNTARFLPKQFSQYKKFVDGEFIVVDNSNDFVASNEIFKYAKANGLTYLQPLIQEGDFSRSHGKACNWAFWKLHEIFDLLLFTDHDLFPIRPLELNFMLDKVIAGVPQTKNGEIYLWAGLVAINTRLVDKSALDFMPLSGMDTGGELNKVFKQLPKDKYHLFAERPQADYSDIYFDDQVQEPTFIHFRNGSNWANETQYEQRIEKLMQKI